MLEKEDLEFIEIVTRFIHIISSSIFTVISLSSLVGSLVLDVTLSMIMIFFGVVSLFSAMSNVIVELLIVNKNLDKIKNGKIPTLTDRVTNVTPSNTKGKKKQYLDPVTGEFYS